MTKKYNDNQAPLLMLRRRTKKPSFSEKTRFLLVLYAFFDVSQKSNM